MKFHKLIELCKEMEDSLDVNDNLNKLDQEEIMNMILYLERCAKRAGFYVDLKAPSLARGRVCFSIGKKGEERGPVEIKIWDNQEHHIRNRFSLTRIVTDEKGFAEVSLAAGDYEAQVGCGPEYKTELVPFSVKEKETAKVEAVLERISCLTLTGWLAGDLHHHSIYSSPAYGGTDPVIESCEDVCRSMKAMGMQFGALSDHHNTLNHEEWKKQTDHFTPLISKEISTSNGHVLALGVEDDVIYEIPKGKDRSNEKLLAEFVRITDEIRSKGGLPQVNHPYDASSSTSFNPAFQDEVLMFESYEIWNGATPFLFGTKNGKAFDRWLRYLEEGKRITATTGSDTHNIMGDDYFWMIEWITWLMETVIENPDIYPEVIRPKVDYMIALYRNVFPMLVTWVEKSNSPSTIHNYIYTGGKKDSESILQAIREGKVFVSNGPLLTVKINGAGIGENAVLSDKKGDLEITLLCKEPVEHLYLYTGAEKRTELSLKAEKRADGSICYDHFLSGYEFADAPFAVFAAVTGPDCLAITNPIFFR